MLSDYCKTLPQFILPKQALSVLAGLLASSKQPKLKNYLIKQFIAQYQINMQEALEENPLAYASFNDFFTRPLKPELRPLGAEALISPVDGYLSEFGSIIEGQMLQAKGQTYSVGELLTTNSVSTFSSGSFATLYLSPQDYHRVHMPMAGVLQNMVHVPGRLFSVQPSTVKVIPRLFSRNERLVVFFTTPLGPMAMVLVGATIVGSIETRWQPELKRSDKQKYFDYQTQPESLRSFAKGEEMGRFKLGSTVILLISQEARLTWLKHLKVGDKLKFGQGLAT